MSERTVLVVDDEPLIRINLAEALEEEGYRVLEASNALEAIAVIARYPHLDGLVTDIDMPGVLNGLDLVQVVARQGPPMAIIVTSGGHRPVDNDLPPACRFLAKPYRMAELVAELDRQMQPLPSPIALAG